MKVVIALCFTLVLFRTAAQAAPEGYSLVWQDEFDEESLEQDKWNISLERRDSAQQSEKAVSTEDGVLKIRTATRDGKHLTGFLTTKGKFESRYGYYEARIRFHGAPGEWCAFWLQSASIGKPVGDPARAGVEVDIVEHRLMDENQKNISDSAVVNLHWDGYVQDHKRIGSVLRSGNSPLENNWHVYSVLWTPENYVVFVDGVKQWSVSEPVSQVAQHVRLTCEVRDHSWAGPVPAGGYGENVGMDVDWVRVWQPN